MGEVVKERYALQDDGPKIPQGNQSTVVRAFDLKAFDYVAVKFIQPWRDEFTKRMFERETEALRRLSHPSIIGIRDSGVDETGTPYVVLEWVDSSLEQLLSESSWDRWDDFYTTMFRPIVSAISYAHLNNTEHRDIYLKGSTPQETTPRIAAHSLIFLAAPSPSWMSPPPMTQGLSGPSKRGDATVVHLRPTRMILTWCVPSIRLGPLKAEPYSRAFNRPRSEGTTAPMYRNQV
ncbi:protein kinase domain-containing protein [uncultured Microbacterium sp.]|uniref:protein kinase domain-containing protein n=1 Tax=uncultured Microbacterium sp. TaxID=191216 RepID=UPI0028EDA58A|nr:protein kinase [uncultured Microbacterium sp.]